MFESRVIELRVRVKQNARVLLGSYGPEADIKIKSQIVLKYVMETGDRGNLTQRLGVFKPITCYTDS